MLIYGSVFSGIGGIDRGLDLAGHRAAWQCEIDPKCAELLQKKWGVPLYRDVRTISDVEEVDILTGGFPCQNVSVAGARAGLAGQRSRLFHQFIRLIAEIAPTWVVIENVPGLLSSNGGRDMGAVLGKLADLGYGWAYRVLDAQYFGVAQRRRRVFIVGYLGNPARAAEVLFEPESCDRDSPPKRKEGAKVAGTLGAGAGGAIPAPTTRCGSTLDDQQTQQLVVSVAENQRGEVRLGGLFNLTTGGGKPGQGYPAVLLKDELTVRRLTPLECERLQGFPGGWTEGFSDSARYKMLGNAVCVPVAEWIGRGINSL